MKKTLLLSSTVLIIAFASFCTNNQPDSLVIGMVPSTSPEMLKDNFEEIRTYLEREMSIQIELFVPDDYKELIAAMKSGQVDIGLYGAFSYIIADQDQDLDPLVVRKRKDMGVTYNSLLITRPDSGLDCIEDIQGLRMAFVNSASTSGYIIPYALFTSRSIDIETYFSSYYFAGSHDLVAEDVIAGRADVGVMSKSILRGLINTGRVRSDDLKIIWESDPIPGSPFIARTELNDRLKDGFVEAMLNIHERDPEALAAYSSSLEGYVPIQPEMYNSIRNIVSVLGEDFIIENYLGT